MNSFSAFLIGVLVGALIIFFTPNGYIKKMEVQAVKLGAADWVVDPETGKTTFTWKEPK